jgi:hypothetical protein
VVGDQEAGPRRQEAVDLDLDGVDVEQLGGQPGQRVGARAWCPVAGQPGLAERRQAGERRPPQAARRARRDAEVDGAGQGGKASGRLHRHRVGHAATVHAGGDATAGAR